MEESIIVLVQKIADECNLKKIDATPALVAYTVRSIISVRINEFNFDITQGLDPQTSQLIHEEAIDLLQNDQSLQMQTIRMQVDLDLGLAQVDRTTKQKEERDKEHREAIEQELTTTKARSTAALESLYRKIVSYSIIISKWGSPNDPQIVRQATACMEQVFPPSEISKFISQNEEDKKRMLNDVSQIVLGARVFQTFGSDLADPSTNLRLEVPRKIEQVRSRITTSIENLNSLIIEYSNILKEEPGQSPEEKQKSSRLSEELVNRQQFLFFYELLYNRLKDVFKEC